MAISRVHETVSVFTKGKGVIRRSKIPYLEMKGHDIAGIIQDINRLKATFKNAKSFDAVEKYLDANQITSTGIRQNLSTTVSSSIEGRDRCMSVAKAINEGFNEKTIIRSDRCESAHITSHAVSVRKNVLTGDRACNVMNSTEMGMNEKTIIKESRDHYNTIHPTQKPVRLLERLLQLVVEPYSGAVVLDPFAGSMSTGEACLNLGLNGILIEKDKEYFDSGCQRINTATSKAGLFAANL